MSKATYWQRGETLDYRNTTDTKIEANSILSFGSHIGIAGTNIFPGELGSIHVAGVFEMPKTSTEVIEMGTEVYFDGSGITNTKNDNAPIAGYAVQAAAASDTVILVKLLG